MSWPMVAVLLAGCAALGALVGRAPSRLRLERLLGVTAVAAAVVFLPGNCVTAMASAPFGDPPLVEGRNDCDTLYGAALPDLGRVDDDVTGDVLAVIGAAFAGITLVLVRRRRQNVAH